MEPRTLKVVLPLPSKPLQPNWRGHWAVKSKAVKQARFDSLCAAVAAAWDATLKKFPPMKSAEVRPTFYFPTKRRRDGSNANASLKAYEDGLEDAGVIENDCGFIWHPPKMLHDKENPRVELLIVEVIEQLRNPEKPRRAKA